MIGKAVSARNRDPGGPTQIWFNSIGSQLRKHINLCAGCSKWKPGSEHNCAIAQSVYEHQKAQGVGGPITQCVHMEPKE